MSKFCTCYFACRSEGIPENSIEFRVLEDCGDLVKFIERRPEIIQRVVEGFSITFEKDYITRKDLLSGELIIDPFFFIMNDEWKEITKETYLKCKYEFFTLKESKEMFPELYLLCIK